MFIREAAYSGRSSNGSSPRLRIWRRGILSFLPQGLYCGELGGGMIANYENFITFVKNNKNTIITMKKIILGAICALTALAADAQVFVGGTFGVATEKTSVSDRLTTFTLAPTVGYTFSDRVTAGIEFAYDYADQSSISVNAINLGPYFRYSFFEHDGFSIFGEAGVYYTYSKTSGAELDNDYDASGVSVILRPGVAYSFNSNWQILAKSNLFSFQSADGETATGFAINPSNVSLGVAYYF